MRRLRTIVAVHGCAAALVAAACPALGGLTAQVVPARCQVTALGGAPEARDVVVSNIGSEPVVVRVLLSDLQVDETGDLDLLPPGSTAETLTGAIEWSPREFSLQPGESGRVQVTLRLPADGPATRWGVLLSEVRPTDFTARRIGPRAIAQLGTTFYLSRIPEDRIRPEVVDMHAAPRGPDSIEVAVTVRNAGERHFYVTGALDLRSSGGTLADSLNVGTGVVLPGRLRSYTWRTRGPASPGEYTVTATLDTGEPELLVVETSFTWPAPTDPTLPVAHELPR